MDLFKNLKLTGLLALVLLPFNYSNGQTITLANTLTPQQLVENILVGQGIVVSNITYNGSAVNAQTVQGNTLSFNALSTPFPFGSGVLLRSNGGVGTVAFDPDLNALATNTVTNGVILEFDFIPSGDTLSFKYMFASSEYPNYVCSNYNDVFGFFISGPGIAGPYQNGAENIALVPNSTTEVSINTVNPGVAGGSGNPTFCAAQDPNWQANAIYYTSQYATYTGYDYNGGTVVMVASANLQCGEVYHIKLAISNVGDQALDSGVFLESNSFSSEAVEIAVATVSGDTSVVEGCSNAQFSFIRPTSNDTLMVNYIIGGTAVMGTDYNNMPNPIIFLPGQDTIVLTLNPIQDGLNEGSETVIFTAYTITACGDTIVAQGVLYILDGPNLAINETDPTVYCANDSVIVSAFASGGYPPYSYSWSYGGQVGDTAYVPISQNGTIDYYVTATDFCGFTGTDTITVTMNQTLAIDTMYMFEATACNPDGAVSGVASGITGFPQYNWTGPYNSGSFSIDATVLQNIPAGMYYFTVTDGVCSVNDSILVTQSQPPIAQLSASILAGCDPLTVTFTNTSQNTTNYAWNFGNGQTANVNDLSSQTQTYSNSAVIQLIAFQGNCSDTATVSISVSVCGCTDPSALNYNPAATVNDGSCTYPIPPTPTVEAPNVFTPNAGEDNPIFFLTTTNAANVELTIINRWGNTVFDQSGLNPGWDGKVNGVDAAEGVYFYKYTVTGLGGDKLEGHGFLQLFR